MDNGNSNSMMGGNADWLILLLLLFGQGRGGLFGANGVDGLAASAISNEFQMTQGKLDAITASTNAGFSNTQMSFAAVAQQLAKCCCDIQLLTVTTNNETNRHIDQVLFDTTTVANNNAQRVVDRIDVLQDNIKDQRIHDLETQLNACNTRDTIGAAVGPINATLAAIMSQLNCGVKSIQYSPSLPVFAGPIAPPFAFGYSNCGGYPFGGFGGPCGPGVPFGGPGYGYGNQGFPGVG